MRQLARSYLQHGRRHSFRGSDPIPDLPSPAALANLQFFGSTITLDPHGSSDEQNIGWTSFATTDTSVFGTNNLGAYAGITNTTGDHTLILLQPGLYLATMHTTWENGTFANASFVDVILSDANLTQRVGFTNNEGLTTNSFAGFAGQIYPFSIQAAFLDPGDQGALRGVVQNWDTGASRSVTEANMSCFYWDCGDLSLTSVY